MECSFKYHIGSDINQRDYHWQIKWQFPVLCHWLHCCQFILSSSTASIRLHSHFANLFMRSFSHKSFHAFSYRLAGHGLSEMFRLWFTLSLIHPRWLVTRWYAQFICAFFHLILLATTLLAIWHIAMGNIHKSQICRTTTHRLQYWNFTVCIIQKWIFSTAQYCDSWITATARIKHIETVLTKHHRSKHQIALIKQRQIRNNSKYPKLAMIFSSFSWPIWWREIWQFAALNSYIQLVSWVFVRSSIPFAVRNATRENETDTEQYAIELSYVAVLMDSLLAIFVGIRRSKIFLCITCVLSVWWIGRICRLFGCVFALCRWIFVAVNLSECREKISE